MREVGEFLGRIVEKAAFAFCHRAECDSPIEVILFAELCCSLGAKAADDQCIIKEIDFDSWNMWIYPQQPIGKYRVDFLLVALTDDKRYVFLVIECDGKDYHGSDDQIAYDRERDQWMRDHRFNVLRFTGSEINFHVDAVIRTIDEYLRRCGVRTCLPDIKEKTHDC